MEMFEGIEIHSIEGIIEYNEVQDFPKRYVLIDDIEDAVNFDSNFEILFDMLVSSNGTKYWEVSPNKPRAL